MRTIIKFKCCCWQAGLSVLLLAGMAAETAAQTSYPMLMSIGPVAVQQGTTAEVNLSSRYDMAGTYAVLISGEGVSAEPILPEGKDGKPATNVTSLNLKVTVAQDALPGVRDLRIATPTGVSTVGQLVVTRQPVFKESGKNNTAQEANEVELPATICGTIEANEDVDFFRFRAGAGERFIFHVQSMRLQNRIHDLQQHVDPIIALRHSNGSTIAMNDNTFFADPVLFHEFTADGEYLLEIRDVRYQGNRYWQYAIEVSREPLVASTHPLAVHHDSLVNATVSPIGWGLPESPPGAHHLVKASPDASGSTQFATVQVQSGDWISNPVNVVLTESEVIEEQDSDNNTLETAQPVKFPSVIAGRIAPAADLDMFSLELKKGDRLNLLVGARRLQSELDSVLRVLNAEGKAVVENDDLKLYKHTFADSWIENWSAPADGQYFVEIRDLHLRGGDRFVYSLSIEPAAPTFELYLDTDKTQLTPGTSGVLFVNVVRKNGFEGDIELTIDGLPDGVSAECGIIPAGRRDGCIVLTANPDAPLICSPVTIRGTAEVDLESGESRPLTRTATPYQETYQPGGGRGHWPVDQHVVAVGAPSDLRDVRLSTYEVAIKPGESVRIDVELERAEGFDKNVQLDMLFRHLSSVYADTLPPGISIDTKNSQTLLTGKKSAGHITLTAAKDAKPADGQMACVMANVSLNFVMKATYSSRPLRISVLAAE